MSIVNKSSYMLNNNIDYTYIKKNIVSILFQLWFSPMLIMSFINGSYYENNNDYKNMEYIRNYECINLLIEYFYFNPFVICSSMMIHHIIAIILPHTCIIYQDANVPIISTFMFMANINITTNFLLDAVKIFHKSSIIKAIFVTYYFILRIVIPIQSIYHITTGYYFKLTPSEYIPLTIVFSCGSYIGYSLNIFWFYKIMRIAKKLIISNNINTSIKNDISLSKYKPHQPDTLPPCDQTNINTSKFVYIPCGH